MLEEGVIEGPFSSEYVVGWVTNMVINSIKWDPSKICLILDPRQMGYLIGPTHYLIPTAEQLRHEFSGLDRLSVIDLNHAFHQMELNEDK